MVFQSLRSQIRSAATFDGSTNLNRPNNRITTNSLGAETTRSGRRRVFGCLGADPAGLQGRRAVPRRQGRDQARLSMRDQLCYREYRSDDGDDVDDERTEDQAEDAVENIGLDRFDFGLQSQPGLAQLAEQIGDLGLQLGAQIDDLGLEFGA